CPPPPTTPYPQTKTTTVPLQPGQSFKFTVLETLDRIKEEFQFLQAQYHSLKLECEKLASEKTEMQRHYIMYYEMSYGLNIEMHKQVRLSHCTLYVCKQEGGEWVDSHTLKHSARVISCVHFYFVS
uniref:TLE family member 5, transcriptional modulator n=1 Tax=Myripristis murdjan TaxID=586833 RepID=A0A667YWX4_9TELE